MPQSDTAAAAISSSNSNSNDNSNGDSNNSNHDDNRRSHCFNGNDRGNSNDIGIDDADNYNYAVTGIGQILLDELSREIAQIDAALAAKKAWDARVTSFSRSFVEIAAESASVEQHSLALDQTERAAQHNRDETAKALAQATALSEVARRLHSPARSLVYSTEMRRILQQISDGRIFAQSHRFLKESAHFERAFGAQWTRAMQLVQSEATGRLSQLESDTHRALDGMDESPGDSISVQEYAQLYTQFKSDGNDLARIHTLLAPWSASDVTALKTLNLIIQQYTRIRANLLKPVLRRRITNAFRIEINSTTSTGTDNTKPEETEQHADAVQLVDAEQQMDTVHRSYTELETDTEQSALTSNSSSDIAAIEASVALIAETAQDEWTLFMALFPLSRIKSRSSVGQSAVDLPQQNRLPPSSAQTAIDTGSIKSLRRSVSALDIGVRSVNATTGATIARDGELGHLYKLLRDLAAQLTKPLRESIAQKQSLDPLCSILGVLQAASAGTLESSTDGIREQGSDNSDTETFHAGGNDANYAASRELSMDSPSGQSVQSRRTISLTDVTLDELQLQRVATARPRLPSRLSIALVLLPLQRLVLDALRDLVCATSKRKIQELRLENVEHIIETLLPKSTIGQKMGEAGTGAATRTAAKTAREHYTEQAAETPTEPPTEPLTEPSVERSTEQTNEHWYPAMTTMINLLARLHKLVDRRSFVGIADVVVLHFCQSLEATRVYVAQTRPEDAEMFVIKQLLLAKEQLLYFDIGSGSSNSRSDDAVLTQWDEATELDEEASDNRSIFESLTTRTRQFSDWLSPRKFLGFSRTGSAESGIASAPAIAEIDLRLRGAIERFTERIAHQWLEGVVLASDGLDSTAAAQLMEATKRMIGLFLENVAKYFGDPRTARHLLAAVRQNMLGKPAVQQMLDDASGDEVRKQRYSRLFRLLQLMKSGPDQ